MSMTKITVRASGKCHPAFDDNGFIYIACSCRGSRNGRLANESRKVADGWDVANCDNKPAVQDDDLNGWEPIENHDEVLELEYRAVRSARKIMEQV